MPPFPTNTTYARNAASKGAADPNINIKSVKNQRGSAIGQDVAQKTIAVFKPSGQRLYGN